MMRMRLAVLALTVAAASAQQPNPDPLLQTAIHEQEKGDLQAAIRDYRKVIELHPDAVEARVNLGAALVHVGRFDEAIAMYRSALPSLAFKNPVLLDLALAYYKKGDFAAAHEHFETLHQAQPRNLQVAILLGDTDVRLKKAEDAVALLEPLSADNAANLDFEYVYGSALIATGRRRDGVLDVEKTAQGQNSADAYLLAGATYLQMNHFEAARRDLEEALRLNSKLPNVYTLVGEARDKTGDAQQAEPAFREALKIDPNDFEANLYLGAILYKRRDMSEAKAYLDHALTLNPKDPMVRYQSAMLKSTSGEYEAAAQALEQLVKDDPDWLEPHVELANLYYRLHRPHEGARERQVVERLSAEQQSRGPEK
jgi:tetratricopeptide (TPR) repeat protein